MARPEHGIKRNPRLQKMGVTKEDLGIIADRMIAEGFDLREGGRYTHNGERRPDAAVRIAKELLKGRASSKTPVVDYSALATLDGVEVTLKFHLPGAKLAEWLSPPST
jgi:hypothetical protein